VPSRNQWKLGLTTKKTKYTKKINPSRELAGGYVAELVYEQESYQIMGACFEVYKAMGRGFLEPVYQERLEIELSDRGIPFLAQHELQIVYKGRTLEQTYKPDFVCSQQASIMTETRT
jgi:PD-(D/E)XK nuclease superfamily